MEFFVHGVGCPFLLQGIFPTQESNLLPLHLLQWHANSLPLCHLGSPLFSALDAKVEAPSGGVVGTSYFPIWSIWWCVEEHESFPYWPVPTPTLAEVFFFKFYKRICRNPGVWGGESFPRGGEENVKLLRLNHASPVWRTEIWHGWRGKNKMENKKGDAESLL